MLPKSMILMQKAQLQKRMPQQLMLPKTMLAVA